MALRAPIITPPPPPAPKASGPIAPTPVLKKWLRLFRAWRHHAAAVRLKREIARLEKERLMEKTALQRQRRFYERLFRRQVNTLRPPMTPLPPRPVSAAAEPMPAPAAVPPAAPAKAIHVPDFAEYMAAAAKRRAEKPLPLPVPPPPAASSAPLPPAPVPVPVPAAAPSHQSPKPPLPPRAGRLSKVLGGFGQGSLAKKLAQEREQEKAFQERNEVERRFWQPYAAVKPNLIKNQATVFFNWHEHFLGLILSVVISCLTLALVYVSLLVWQKERLQNNQTLIINTKAIESQIDKNEHDIREVIAFNDKLTLVASLLDNHAYWSKLLVFLENNTLKDVYYENFKGDLSGTYAIPAIARSLEAVSLQTEVMKAHGLVKEAHYDLKPSGDAKDKVFFTLGLSLDPEIFIK